MGRVKRRGVTEDGRLLAGGCEGEEFEADLPLDALAGGEFGHAGVFAVGPLTSPGIVVVHLRRDGDEAGSGRREEVDGLDGGGQGDDAEAELREGIAELDGGVGAGGGLHVDEGVAESAAVEGDSVARGEVVGGAGDGFEDTVGGAGAGVALMAVHAGGKVEGGFGAVSAWDEEAWCPADADGEKGVSGVFDVDGHLEGFAGEAHGDGGLGVGGPTVVYVDGVEDCLGKASVGAGLGLDGGGGLMDEETAEGSGGGGLNDIGGEVENLSLPGDGGAFTVDGGDAGEVSCPGDEEGCAVDEARLALAVVVEPAHGAGSVGERGGVEEVDLAEAGDKGFDLEDVHAATGEEGGGEELWLSGVWGLGAGEDDGGLAAWAQGGVDGGRSAEVLLEFMDVAAAVLEVGCTGTDDE